MTDPKHEIPETPAGKERSRRDIIYIIIIILLLLANGYSIWKWNQTDQQVKRILVEKESEKEKKEALKKDLQAMLDKYDQLEVNNDSLKKKVKKEREKIKELMDKIDRYQYSLAKAEEEKKTLRKIMQGYVHTIDSLHQVNEQLETENKTIRTELGDVKSKKEKLESKTQDMEKDLKTASVLKTANLKAEAIRINLLGNPKVTTRANRTEKVKTCFTLSENPLAEKGKREIYIRIINPQGQVLAEGEDGAKHKFEFEGVRGQYTLKHTIDYQQKEMELCLYWGMDQDDIPEGKYGIKVYEGDNLIGTTTLTLE